MSGEEEEEEEEEEEGGRGKMKEEVMTSKNLTTLTWQLGNYQNDSHPTQIKLTVLEGQLHKFHVTEKIDPASRGTSQSKSKDPNTNTRMAGSSPMAPPANGCTLGACRPPHTCKVRWQTPHSSKLPDKLRVGASKFQTQMGVCKQHHATTMLSTDQVTYCFN